MIDQPEMLRRVVAAQATLDHFKGKPFSIGTRDCVCLVAFHLRKLGYKIKLPPAGSYRSWRTGSKALRERGYATLPDALDALGLMRIAPAAALVGDIIQMPADHEIGALTVALSNGRVLGFHEDVVGAVAMQPQRTIMAWRT